MQHLCVCVCVLLFTSAVPVTLFVCVCALASSYQSPFSDSAHGDSMTHDAARSAKEGLEVPSLHFSELPRPFRLPFSPYDSVFVVFSLPASSAWFYGCLRRTLFTGSYGTDPSRIFQHCAGIQSDLLSHNSCYLYFAKIILPDKT